MFDARAWGFEIKDFNFIPKNHTSSCIKSKINIYTEINASSENNQIGLEINFHTKIKASFANNQIGLEIKVYTKFNAYIASNQIGLEINSTQKTMHRGEKRDANIGWGGRDIDMEREVLEKEREVE